MGSVSAIIGFDCTANNVFSSHKVVTIDVIYKAIAIIIDVRLTILLLFVDVKIVFQVLVGDVNTTVDNGYNNVFLTCCVLFPNRFNITVSTLLCTCIY